MDCDANPSPPPPCTASDSDEDSPPSTAAATTGTRPDQPPNTGRRSFQEQLSGTIKNPISSLTKSRRRRKREAETAAASKDKGVIVHESSKSGEPEPEKDPEDADPNKQPVPLLALPPELICMILKRLDFMDVVHLRRTCKGLRAFASVDQMRLLWGPTQLRKMILAHCSVCLKHDPRGSQLLLSDPTDKGFPLSSWCVECALRDGKDKRIRVGNLVNLANLDSVWVCRWCGWPVAEDPACGNPQFHPRCYKRYNNRIFLFFLLGWIQLSLGIAGAALAWRYFRFSILVFAPTLTLFLLSWICLFFLILRGTKSRTYHCTLCLELTILCLWIPPIFHLSLCIIDYQGRGEEIPKPLMGALVLFALNMFFRLLNVMGNIVLLCRFDPTRVHMPKVSAWRRMMHPFAAALVYWTYPQALDYKYPRALDDGVGNV